MGYKIMIRIRGFTDWILFGYATTKDIANEIAMDVATRVQIITLPDGEKFEEMLKSIPTENTELVVPGGQYDVIDPRTIIELDSEEN